MKTSRIWLTGSRGFIGSHLVPVLRQDGPDLTCFTNSRSAGSQPEFMDYASERDILRAVAARGLPDVFIHLGWGAMEDPGAAEHLGQNVRDAETLVETLFKAGLGTFVFLGTVNEYGARAGSLSEDLPAEGRMTDYAKGKAEVARFGREKAAQFGRRFISIRLFYTYGAGQRGGSLTNKLYRCHLARTRAELGPCEHYRDYIHVADVAEGIRRISRVEESAVVNLGSGKVVQVREFVELFWKLLGGAPDQLVFGAHAMRAGEPEQPYAYASVDRLRKLTGWAPSLTIQEGIRLTVKGLYERRATDFADV